MLDIWLLRTCTWAFPYLKNSVYSRTNVPMVMTICAWECHGKPSAASVVVDGKISDVQYRTVSVITGHLICRYKKAKWSRYRPGVTQSVGRGIALLFHDRGTRGGWVVSSTPRPHFTPGKDPVPILQEAGWAPGPVWTGGKSLPLRDSIPDRPARSSVAIPIELPAHGWSADTKWLITCERHQR